MQMYGTFYCGAVKGVKVLNISVDIPNQQRGWCRVHDSNRNNLFSFIYLMDNRRRIGSPAIGGYSLDRGFIPHHCFLQISPGTDVYRELLVINNMGCVILPHLIDLIDIKGTNEG